MDEISRRRSNGGLSISRNGPGLVLRDTADSRDQNTRFCNRHGCNGRLKSMKSAQTGYLQKNKLPGSIHSSNGKEILGSSSKTCSRVKNSKRTLFSPSNKGPSETETVSSETSSVQDEPDVLQLIRPAGKIQTALHSAVDDAESGDSTFMEVGKSTIASKARLQKITNQNCRLGNPESPKNSFVPLACKSTVRHDGASSSRYNLRCSSMSDAYRPDCSLSEASVVRRKDMVKKRSSEGESSSSAKGKKISETSFEGKGKSRPGHGIAINDSRRSRNWPPSSRDNNVASVRSPRLTNDNRSRFSSQKNMNNLLTSQSPVVIPRREIAGSSNSTSLSHRFSGEGFNRKPTYCTRPGSSSENARSIMAMGPMDAPMTSNHDGMRCYNIDGIAEVLLTLERIGQDEEITYEQMLVLETSLYGLPFHDQHRDMRLDIDNMTYEELLDLEERMGTVSTALSEEDLSTCLKRSTHQPASLGTQVMDFQADYDDIKCCICQEEYLNGDDVGRLQCEHKYHTGCIQEWLRLKNWCPICKASVAAPASS